MTVQPTAITRQANGDIQIQWDDNTLSRWTPSQLRRACPCATCREKQRASEQAPARPTSLPVLSVAETRPLRIESMRPVGNYAYHIAFSDGHDSGLFTFTMLHDGFDAIPHV